MNHVCPTLKNILQVGKSQFIPELSLQLQLGGHFECMLKNTIHFALCLVDEFDQMLTVLLTFLIHDAISPFALLSPETPVTSLTCGTGPKG